MMAPYLWCAYVSSKFILPPFPWRLLQLKKKKKEESPMRTILECIQQFRAGREHTSVLAKASPPPKKRRRRKVVGVFVGPCLRLPSIAVTKKLSHRPRLL
jgi:hypothetical protein